MKFILKLEEFAMFLLGTMLFFQLGYAWWWFLVLILTPDVGMVGYLINPRVGAITYNILHHKAGGIGLLGLGLGLQNQIVMTAGIIIFTHSSLDRVFGYGLKHPDSFKNTHLGQI